MLDVGTRPLARSNESVASLNSTALCRLIRTLLTRLTNSGADAWPLFPEICALTPGACLHRPFSGPPFQLAPATPLRHAHKSARIGGSVPGALYNRTCLTLTPPVSAMGFAHCTIYKILSSEAKSSTTEIDRKGWKERRHEQVLFPERVVHTLVLHHCTSAVYQMQSVQNQRARGSGALGSVCGCFFFILTISVKMCRCAVAMLA